MSLVVLDIECVEKNIIKELGIFHNGTIRGYSFLPPKKYKPSKQTYWLTNLLHNIHWQSGAYDYTQLENILNVENFEHAEFFAKGSEKCKILSQILNKPVEKLGNLSCPPASALVFRNEKGECDWICSSYPLRHLKTLHCAERKAYVYGLWTKTHLALPPVTSKNRFARPKCCWEIRIYCYLKYIIK